MAIKVDPRISPAKLRPQVQRLFDVSGDKILLINRRWNPDRGTPVFTVKGRYTSRGWTEWTQGFQFGAAILQYEVTGDPVFLELGREATVQHMASHVSHIGVHDHGFNNVSTYGNLLRLAKEGRFEASDAEREYYRLALKVSGATQAARWTQIANGEGYIYSFNGPHSLFIDTIRSLRVLAVAHQLGHVLMGERDQPISLLERLIFHARTTAAYGVYYGAGRDHYDVRGRTAHESVFNLNDGHYRCPSTQQGYSPFSTWTRGLAWAICGYAEQLEFVRTLPAAAFEPFGGRVRVVNMLRRAAEATADHYIEFSSQDGIPMWDFGAPGLARLGDFGARDSDPFNGIEPVDSSAAAIAAQGLIRLGRCLRGESKKAHSRAKRYRQAGYTIARSLFAAPYLSTDPRHQGLILHSIYHRPNGWDHVPAGQRIPCGESSMWGDYHALELGMMIWRESQDMPPYHFYDCV